MPEPTATNPLALKERIGSLMPAAVVSGACFASGLWLRLAPFVDGLAWTLPFGTSMALSALWCRRPGIWAAGGGCFGLAWAGALCVGVIKWGFATVVGLCLGVALSFALFWGVVGWVANRVAPRWRPAAVAASWCLLSFVVDRFAYAAVFATAPLAALSPMASQAFHWIGAPGVEALAVFGSACLARAACERRGRAALGCLALPLVVGICAWLPAGARIGQGLMAVVQPSFEVSDYAAASWSLEGRHFLQRRLDRLTREATAGPPATILWPENGSGLADSQLPERRRALRRLLVGGEHDLLAVGLEYDAPRVHLAAAHWAPSGRIRAVARKAFTVPLAESDIAPGKSAVFDTVAGRVGIAICFDVLFARHVRSSVRGGAEMLAVTSDNASFGDSLLPEWHRFYATLRASEVGRSMVFAANRGPAYLFDWPSASTRSLTERGERGVATVAVTRHDSPVPAHLTAPALAVAVLLLGWRASVRSWRRNDTSARWSGRWATPSRAHAGGLAFTLGLALPTSLAGDVIHTSMARGTTIGDVLTDMTERLSIGRGSTALGALFRQSRRESCGLASLAFGLTALGDDLFEEDLLSRVELDPAGASLRQLERLAEERGFLATPVRASTLGALHLGPGRVALAHLTAGHFIALWQAGGVLRAFDPRTGALSGVDSQRLTAAWSGNALILQHRPLTPTISEPVQARLSSTSARAPRRRPVP